MAKAEAAASGGAPDGSYFKRELTKARDDKRIGLPVPYDPGERPFFCDIGMDDENCIWFYQGDGVRHRLTDFYSNSGALCRGAAREA